MTAADIIITVERTPLQGDGEVYDLIMRRKAGGAVTFRVKSLDDADRLAGKLVVAINEHTIMSAEAPFGWEAA